ncbi:SIR2 family NAD-dependent protein deacylase [Blastopirellula marina]|nr:SIR2 family protein [Blastopirellula marina]
MYSMPPTRNSALSKANEEAFADLQRMLHDPQNNNVLGVVGAGVSVRAGYPSWSELLSIMADQVVSLDMRFVEVVNKLGMMQDVTWRAEEYRRLMTEDRYYELIRKVFGSDAKSIDQCIENLIDLNFRHVLTTNYDTVLERAHFQRRKQIPETIQWTNAFDVREFMYQATNGSYGRRYVYLHGRYNDPSCVVLTDRDYVQRYLLQNDAAAKLAALFSTFSLVFIGFSISDPALTQLLQQVKFSLGVGAPRHYAILALNTADDDELLVRNRLSNKYGIEPVFYPLDSSHEGLCDLINLLKEPPGEFPPPMPTMPRPSGPADPDDPQKGQWGGTNEADGYQLTAEVDGTSHEESPETFAKYLRMRGMGRRLYHIKLKVIGPTNDGIARFYLHPTFVPDRRDVSFRRGIATLDLLAYGAFTIGVEILETNTRLELDLSSDLVDAPRAFKES